MAKIKRIDIYKDWTVKQHLDQADRHLRNMRDLNITKPKDWQKNLLFEDSLALFHEDKANEKYSRLTKGE